MYESLPFSFITCDLRWLGRFTSATQANVRASVKAQENANAITSARESTSTSTSASARANANANASELAKRKRKYKRKRKRKREKKYKRKLIRLEMETQAEGMTCTLRISRTFSICGMFSQGEGVAYRGRLLVELESKLGEEIDKELEVMSSSELIRVQVDHFQFFSNSQNT